MLNQQRKIYERDMKLEYSMIREKMRFNTKSYQVETLKIPLVVVVVVVMAYNKYTDESSLLFLRRPRSLKLESSNID